MKKQMLKRIACVAASLAVLGCSSLAYAGELNPTTEVAAPYGLSDLITVEPHTWVHSGNFVSTTYIQAPEDVVSMEVNVYMGYDAINYSYQGNSAVINYSGGATDNNGNIEFTVTLHFTDGQATIHKTVNVFNYFCGMSHSYTNHCYDTGFGPLPSSSQAN